MEEDFIKVDPRHVKGAFMDLPRLLGKAADEYVDQADAHYVNALTDPFSHRASDVRVPNMIDVPTITNFDLQTFQFTADETGRAILVINYDASRVGPYLLVNGPLKAFSD
jgi:hypothetical protein